MAIDCVVDTPVSPKDSLRRSVCIHIADLSYLYLPAPVGNAGTGVVTQVQTIRGLYQFGIGPFLVIIVIKEGMGRRPFDFTQRRLSAGQTENWNLRSCISFSCGQKYQAP